tara:strand:- start:153593 stop:153895 length:303 start_codon:yes stop_codon:yes gene_type:complete
MMGTLAFLMRSLVIGSSSRYPERIALEASSWATAAPNASDRYFRQMPPNSVPGMNVPSMNVQSVNVQSVNLPGVNVPSVNVPAANVPSVNIVMAITTPLF